MQKVSSVWIKVSTTWINVLLMLCKSCWCPAHRPGSPPACSSTGPKQSCPGTLDRRPGYPVRSCPALWPPVPPPSGSWWEKLNWWVSAQTFSLWTHLTPTPVWTGAGSTSSRRSQRTLSTTTWVRFEIEIWLGRICLNLFAVYPPVLLSQMEKGAHLLVLSILGIKSSFGGLVLTAECYFTQVTVISHLIETIAAMCLI